MTPTLLTTAVLLPKVGLVAGLATVLLVRLRKYRRVVSYDPRQDYAFPFEACGATRLAARAKRGQIHLPRAPESTSTLFLEVDVRPLPGARCFTPRLVIEAPGYREEHHFERGARGRRFLNISGLAPTLAQGDCTIRLHQSWSQCADGECNLWALTDSLSDVERLLVVAPHPDDAEISAFSLYSRHAERSMIVTITAGEHGNLRADLELDADDESRLKGELRTYDSVVVGLWGGIPPERSVNLGYFDRQLRSMRQQPSRAVESGSGVTDPNTFRQLNVHPLPALDSANWNALVDDIRTFVRTFKPTTIVCPHPLVDGHLDHIFGALAVLEAIEGEEHAPTKLALYFNHPRLTEAYPFGPAGQPMDMPPLFGDLPTMGTPMWVPLTRSAQIRKAYAMNMMHDLRPAPEHLRRARPLQALAASVKDWLLGTPEYDISFFRRAIRTGELFFVVDERGIAALRGDLLASLVGELEEPQPSGQMDVGRRAAAS